MMACWEQCDEDIELIHRSSVGDIVTFTDGKRYKIEKKTTTACAVTRYYWFHEWLDKWKGSNV
jgi:uncharacterized protein YkvS